MTTLAQDDLDELQALAEKVAQACTAAVKARDAAKDADIFALDAQQNYDELRAQLYRTVAAKGVDIEAFMVDGYVFEPDDQKAAFDLSEMTQPPTLADAIAASPSPAPAPMPADQGDVQAVSP